MYETYQRRGYPEELERFVRLEYGADAGTVHALIAQADGVRSAKKEKGVGRAILRALARIPDVLAAAATPGSA